jgi:hypothetical protein
MKKYTLLFLLIIMSIWSNGQMQVLMGINNRETESTQNYTFGKLSINYNNTDATYLTDESSKWTDAGPGTMYNVITMTTVASNLTGSSSLNANTGMSYFEKEGPPSEDEVLIKTIFPNQIAFYNVSQFTTTTTIPTPVRTVAATQTGQGLAFDSILERVYEDQTNNLKVMDLSGTLIENVSRPSSSGQLYFNQDNGELFVCQDTGQPVKRYTRSGSSFSLAETYWYTSSEGCSYDKIFGKFLTQASSVRFQDLQSGFKTLLYPNPLTGSENEGTFVDPRDGTVWKCSDDYFHGTINNGNRFIHHDPRRVYGKWIHFPNLVRYSRWKLTSTLAGEFGNQTLTGNDWNISPVIDYKSFTGQQSLSNYYYEGAELEFRGSGTAPTTTGVDYINLTIYDANGTNDGWGATSPGAWQSTPTTDRYMQIRLKPVEVTPPAPAWSPVDLTTQILWSDMTGIDDVLGFKGYDEYVDFGDEPSAGIYRIPTLINKAATDNNWTQTTQTNRPRFNLSANYSQYIGANVLNHTLTSVSDVTALTEVDIHTYVKKPTANSTAIIFSAHNTANSNYRITAAWLPGNHATCANCIAIIENDASANVSLVGVANSSTDWTYITYRLGVDGAWDIFVGGVEQTLTVVSGSNTGNCFNDLTGVNSVRIGRIQGGTATPLTVRDGTQDMKSILFTAPSETNFSNISTYFSGL